MQRRESCAQPAQLPRLNVPALPSASIVPTPSVSSPPQQSAERSPQRHWLKELPHGPGVLFFYRFATTRDKWLLSVGVVMAIASGALFPALPVAIVGRTLDDLALATDTSAMARAMRDLACIACGVFVLDYVTSLCFEIAIKNEATRLRCHVFRHALHLPMAWHDASAEHDLARRLSTTSMEQLDRVLVEQLPALVRDASQIAVAMIVAHSHGTQVPWFAFALFQAAFTTINRMIQEDRKKKVSDAKSDKITTVIFGQIRTIMSLNGQQRALAADNKAQNRRHHGAIEVWVFATVFRALTTFWIGLMFNTIKNDGRSAIDFPEARTASDVLRIVAITCVVVIANNRIVFAVACVIGALKRTNELLEVLRIKRRSIDSGSTIASCKGELEFKNVHLNHPMDPSTPVLQALNLRIPAGTTVALVSSLPDTTSAIASLVQRFHDPQRGEITLDGRDIEDLNMGWLQAQIGVVSSQPALFGGTVFENIALGVKGITRDQVEAAARRAELHDWIQSLPHRYDTLVGGACGVAPTSTQSRLIALARAIARKSTILIIEETLDVEGNDALARALGPTSTKTASVTTLVVTNRVGSALLRRAHNVIVFSAGNIVESGTHEDLVTRKSGLYKTTYDQHALEMAAQLAEEHRQHSADAEPEPELTGAVPPQPEISMLSIAQLSPSAVVLVLCAGIVITTGVAAFSYEISDFMDQIAMAHRTELLASDHSPHVHEVTWGEVKTAYKRCLAAGAIATLTGLIVIFALECAQVRKTGRARSLLLRAILYQPITFFAEKDHSPSALAAELSHRSQTVASIFGEDLSMSLSSGFALIGALWVIYTGGIKVASVGLLALLGLHAGLRRRTYRQGPVKSSSADQLLSHRLTNIRAVVTHGLEEVSANAFYDAVVAQESHLETHKHAFTFSLGVPFVTAAWALALFYGSNQTKGLPDMATEQVDLSAVMRVLVGTTIALFASRRFLEAVTTTHDNIRASVQAMAYISALDVHRRNCEVGARPASGPGAIAFRDISLHTPSLLPSRGLQHCDFSVRPGETLAVCATSVDSLNCIVDLVERFIDPKSGVVSLDGRDLKTVNVAWLRDQIGVISRDTFSTVAPRPLPGTIAENIAYGLSYEPTRRKIEEVARLVGVHDAIMALPNQYDSVMDMEQPPSGNNFLRYLAIARVLIKNPSVLVVDEWDCGEPSRVLEPVLHGILRAKKRTTILLTRRPTTLQLADRVCVLHEGRVVERGTHRELMRSSSVYQSLVAGQSHESHGKRAFAKRLFGLS